MEELQFYHSFYFDHNYHKYYYIITNIQEFNYKLDTLFKKYLHPSFNNDFYKFMEEHNIYILISFTNILLQLIHITHNNDTIYINNNHLINPINLQIDDITFTFNIIYQLV